MSRYLLRSRDVYHDGTGWTPDVDRAKRFEYDDARTLAGELAAAGVIAFIVPLVEVDVEQLTDAGRLLLTAGGGS